ncbi:MAG: hypothetical protein ACI9SB_001816 [Candidatus Azotimanducaceae bacterium]|jgi:uncharacterized protein (DUF2164 family)
MCLWMSFWGWGVAGITFDKAETERMVGMLKGYFADELDQELGQFDAEFLLDFFAKECGGVFYNRGLYDAQALFRGRVEEIGEAICELEQETGLFR